MISKKEYEFLEYLKTCDVDKNNGYYILDRDYYMDQYNITKNRLSQYIRNLKDNEFIQYTIKIDNKYLIQLFD